MRICSLLPSATEILYGIGAGEAVVGVTHECDYPADAKAKPALIRPRVDPHAAPSEIDRQVLELVARGESIYAVDAELLESLAPDLIVTQDLCHVCAASPDDLATALAKVAKPPRVLTLTPHALNDVWDDIRRTGDATGHRADAETLATKLECRVAEIARKAQAVRERPRVLCLEWLDPFYVGGHWVPEMVTLAGGEDVLGQAGKPSFRVSSEDIAASQADVIVVMPCGYNTDRAFAEASAMHWPQSWSALPAMQKRRIVATDANSYFSRPGPRLAEGVEILAHLLHPEIFPAPPSAGAMRKLV